MKKFIISLSVVLVVCLLQTNMYALDGRAINSANYIQNNLDELNQIRSQEGASNLVLSVEICDIIVETDSGDLEAKFLDFDSDKGYLIVGDNMKVYTKSNFGHSPFHQKEAIKKYFNMASGYFYLNLKDEKVQINLSENFISPFAAQTAYPGQELPGEGRIYDVNQYINARYGSGYNRTKSNRLTYKDPIYNGKPVENYSLLDYTLYYTVTGNVYSPEKIMELMNVFTTVDYLFRSMYLDKANFSTQYHNPEMDEAIKYTQMIQDPNVIAQPRTLKSLYINLRYFALSYFSDIETLDLYDSLRLIIEYLKSKGIKRTYTTSLMYSGLNDLLPASVDAGHPMFFVGNGVTYASTQLLLVGYDYYEKVSGWWIFQTVDFLPLHEVREAWGGRVTWYDFKAYKGAGNIGWLDL